MAIWIRKVTGGKSANHLKLADGDWDLRSQFEVFENWLKTESDSLEPGQSWIADIGFSPRENATGGGPVISKEIMSICVEKNIAIFLSEYGD